MCDKKKATQNPHKNIIINNYILTKDSSTHTDTLKVSVMHRTTSICLAARCAVSCHLREVIPVLLEDGCRSGGTGDFLHGLW